MSYYARHETIRATAGLVAVGRIWLARIFHPSATYRVSRGFNTTTAAPLAAARNNKDGANKTGRWKSSVEAASERFILDTESLFRGKSVLDVGCGCGASSIAAKMVGACSVTANDIDQVALQATLLNAKVNGIMDNVDELDVRNDNLIGNGAATTRYDIVLIGDLFYDTEIAAVLHPWIQRLARAGKKIYIGDPGRHGITDTGVLSNMILHARYELPDNVCLENNGFSHANVWQYQLSTEEKD